MDTNQNEKQPRTSRARWLIPAVIVLSGVVFGIRKWRNRQDA